MTTVNGLCNLTFRFTAGDFSLCCFSGFFERIICWLLDTRGWAVTQHLDHRGCFRHRDERGGGSRDRLEDAPCWMYFWNTEWICKKLVSPKNPAATTHTHTHLFPNPCLNDSYHFWTRKRKENFYLNSEERAKQTISDQLQGNTKQKKKKSSKHWNFLKTAVGDHSRRTVLRLGEGRNLHWRLIFKTWNGGKRTGCFQDTVWRQFGIAIFSSECLSDSREYRCQEEP